MTIKNFKATGKIVVFAKKEKVEKEPKKKIILNAAQQAEVDEATVKADLEFFSTVKVVARGPEVREEIQVGTTIMVNQARMFNFDHMIIGGKVYHIVSDSESNIPLIKV